MIPKKIHYCWFGGKEKDELAEHCLATWKKIHPDFEIIEWNESNAPLKDNNYVKEAFEQEKWAFVSDYVRSKVMLEHGGIYMDTDMVLKLPLDEFLNEKAVCGFEVKGVPYSAFWMAEPQHQLSKDFVAYYDSQDGFVERINTDIFSEMLEEKYGADRHSDTIQHLKHGVTLYPSVYFSQDLPKNYVSHHFNGSWFGGDEENTHKKMVNVYGLLERLVTEPCVKTAVESIITKHKIIDINDILDLLPRDEIEEYLRKN
ncbi:glycosyl transferase [Chryseobacterium sp. Leaf404]|uniref:glycosyltransferase family 32 protein n=1 Tax=unclassified Chryseobacterium TaxID=2593645 RepID=UPI0006F4B7E7|nr:MULTISPECIES: glycosyltransferase [unclassified Chryseobacterium]KQT18152.1 glycosyl transferase [Chryseobacterium sp. Leaf404]